MKRLRKFDEGRHLVNDDLQAIQQQFDQGFGQLFAGTNAFVISGCDVTGAGPTFDVAAGLLWINQKLVVFAGAAGVSLSSSTKLKQATTTTSAPRQYALGTPNVQDGLEEYHAEIVSGTVSGEEYIEIDSTGPKRTLNDVLAQKSIPAGTINQWYGNITTFDNSGLGQNNLRGWALCNGQNGTPDLRGRFVVAYDDRNTDPNNGIWDASYHTKNGDNVPNGTGGETTHALTEAEMPAHSHTITDPGHQHSIGASTSNGTSGSTPLGRGDGATAAETLNTGLANTGITINSAGNGQPHENRPPYYVLAFIMKT